MKLTYATETPNPVTGARPLTTPCSSALLKDLVKQCQQRIMVFDLDSTLLDNRARNVKIMQEFGEAHNEPKLLEAKPAHWTDWSARNAMMAIGLSASDADKLVDAYTSFWQARFFTSDYCQYDTEIAHAVSFVNDVQQNGGIIRYLTGRPEAMRKGTISSLGSLGFPVPGSDDVALIMKPDLSFEDDEYKKNALAQFDMQSGILAAFDNEPAHINAYRTTFPDATCIHLYTDHSMSPARLLGGIVSIVDFTR